MWSHPFMFQYQQNYARNASVSPYGRSHLSPFVANRRLL
jgi:hypothetical protein